MKDTNYTAIGFGDLALDEQESIKKVVRRRIMESPTIRELEANADEENVDFADAIENEVDRQLAAGWHCEAEF